MTPNYIKIGIKTNTYRTFLRIPIALASMIWIGVFIDSGIFGGFILSRLGIEGFAIYWLNGVASMLVARKAFADTIRVCIRSRLWEWGKWRFENWKQLEYFWDNTSPEEIERILGDEILAK